MKNIVRTRIAILIALTTIFSSRSAQSQKLVFLFGHVLYAIPADQNFEKNYSSGLGVEGGIGLGTGRTFVVATVGYSSFTAFDSNPYGKLSYVPIKVGIRRYLLVGKLLFINADAGIGILQNGLYHGSRFSGDIGIGVKLGPLEVMADYDGYAKSSGEGSGYASWIGIKAGMTFGF